LSRKIGRAMFAGLSWIIAWGNDTWKMFLYYLYFNL